MRRLQRCAKDAHPHILPEYVANSERRYLLASAPQTPPESLVLLACTPHAAQHHTLTFGSKNKHRLWLEFVCAASGVLGSRGQEHLSDERPSL